MHIPGAGMGSGDMLRLAQTALDESDASVAKNPPAAVLLSDAVPVFQWYRAISPHSARGRPPITAHNGMAAVVAAWSARRGCNSGGRDCVSYPRQRHQWGTSAGGRRLFRPCQDQ